MSKFGESKIGKTAFPKRNQYKLKDGDNVYRILPAMGDLGPEGRWSVYYSVVWGFKTTDGKKKPFQSPQVVRYNKKDKTKTVEVECAATNLINALKVSLEAAKKAGDSEKVKQLGKLVGDYPNYGIYNIDNNHYVNVIDRQGNVGQLELGYKAKLAVDSELERLLKEEGINALSPDNGRFLNIRRDGKGRDTIVKVTVVKEKINIPDVGEVEKAIVHVIDDALSERLLVQKDGKYLYKEAANLSKLYKRLTSEEVALVVKTADVTTGKSLAMDKLFNKNSQEETQDDSDTSEEAAPTTVQSAPVAPPAASTPKQASVVQEAKAAVAVAQTAPAVATAEPTTAEAIASMSPDDFMKQMGITI